MKVSQDLIVTHSYVLLCTFLSLHTIFNAEHVVETNVVVLVPSRLRAQLRVKPVTLF